MSAERQTCDCCGKSVARTSFSNSFATGETWACSLCRGDREQFELDELEWADEHGPYTGAP